MEQVLCSGEQELLSSLDRESSAGMPVYKRAEKRVDIGFFDQGIVTGGVMLLSTVFTVAGFGCYYGFGIVRNYLQFR